MAIEAINNAGAAMTVAPKPVVKTAEPSVPEAKEANVQTSSYQTASTTDAAVISKVSNQGSDAGNDSNNGNNEKQPSESTLKQIVSDINKKLNNNTSAEFGYHEKTNRVTIKIVDKETKEVIKELPPEKTLEMIAKAWELAGILVDERK